MNQKILEELQLLEKNHGVSVQQLIEKYTITDVYIKHYLQSVAEENNGVIHENHLNKFRLTPRHVQITFDGKYKVKLGNSF